MTNSESMSEEEYRHYVRELVERRLKDIDKGRVYTEEEADRIIDSWLKDRSKEEK